MPSAIRFWLSRCLVVALAASLLPLPGVAAAQTKAAAQGLPPKVPRPDFMHRKSYLPDLLLRDKQEGWYVTVMPAIGVDPGVGNTVLARECKAARLSPPCPTPVRIG